MIPGNIDASARGYWLTWSVLGGVLLLAALGLNAASQQFSPGKELIDMPALELAGAMVAIGAIYLLLLPLIRATIHRRFANERRFLWLVIGFGLIFRLALYWSTPAFETDWNRYLWDGAVVAHGYNPYAASPDDAQGEPYHYSLQPIAHASGTVIERINYSHLKTIYPPVAQAFFALGYAIEPFSLQAWRGILLAAELVTLALLLMLLKEAGRPPLWVALYWWHPVIVKEIFNSAHMEGIVTPFVLGALWLTMKSRHVASALSLGLAIGAKLWPVMLVPLMLRPVWTQPRKYIPVCAILICLLVLWALPIVAGGIDQSSGFVAFTQYWRTNSALFPMLDGAARFVLSGLALPETLPGVIVKGLLAAIAGVFALWMSRTPLIEPQDLMARAGIVTGVLFLLSPAQFPWYAIWMLPFFCFRPSPCLLLASVLAPVYYASFYFKAHDAHEIFRNIVVWIIWVPVWLVLAWELWSARKMPDRSLGPRHA